ncbi:hypothetical protein P378_14470 [Desulforamulus profundi]|uniref:Uncharacterized protein n=1 Tax=Desulforamulus profundi TaxID=1383067 RepID=A0A2C6MDM9_9FIRM|nr:hypothetical protein P378_14470 [Desulforamulus profundi]
MYKLIILPPAARFLKSSKKSHSRQHFKKLLMKYSKTRILAT